MVNAREGAGELLTSGLGSGRRRRWAAGQRAKQRSGWAGSDEREVARARAVEGAVNASEDRDEAGSGKRSRGRQRRVLAKAKPLRQGEDGAKATRSGGGDAAPRRI